jgi:pimeloyl-ACP methyl ester carboxylesterase
MKTAEQLKERKMKVILTILFCAFISGTYGQGNKAARSSASMSANMKNELKTRYKTVSVNGVKIFYREAGSPEKPALLLLHGFPSSSRMFNTLFLLLADRYHLIAPDYPGFGNSEMPPSSDFSYTFDHLAEVVDGFTQAVGLLKYSLYLQDYGGPIGLRLAIAHPERVTAIIIQNAVSHQEGLSPLWEARKAFWKDRKANEPSVIKNFTSPEATRQRHIGTNPSPELIDPDNWIDELAWLNRPGVLPIQLDLFYDYQNNVASYPKFQEWLRKTQPRLLVVWGKYDPSFTVAGAEAYQKDVPKAEVHILNAGHFALDDSAPEIAGYILKFLK